MNVKTILYIIMVPFSIWMVEALNIDKYFKSNRKYQIICFYVVLSISLAYLIVNFIYDFYEVSRIFS